MKLSTYISDVRCFFEDDPYGRLFFDVFMEVAKEPIYAASSNTTRISSNPISHRYIYFDYKTRVVLAELRSTSDCIIVLASTLSGESPLSKSEHHSYDMGIGFVAQEVKIEDLKEINLNLDAQVYFKTDKNNGRVKTCLDRNKRFFRNERKRLFPYAAWLLQNVEKERSDRNLV